MHTLSVITYAHAYRMLLLIASLVYMYLHLYLVRVQYGCGLHHVHVQDSLNRILAMSMGRFLNFYPQPLWSLSLLLDCMSHFTIEHESEVVITTQHRTVSSDVDSQGLPPDFFLHWHQMETPTHCPLMETQRHWHQMETPTHCPLKEVKETPSQWPQVETQS